ncbi:MAG: hypothetical protein HY290_13650 [Planctomycetia bacterium]|nr:hypothetical protein [Planctomycetia bacterium]
MHKSGIVLAVFVILGTLGAIFMSSKAFAVRDAWMKQAQDNEAAIRKNDEEIAARKLTLRDKRNDYARTMFGWDREWMAPAARVEQNGNITLQVGTGQGVQPGQLLYVFAPNAEGTASVYIGDFKVDKANEQGCQAIPNSRRRPSDYKEAVLQNVRVRTMVPREYIAPLETVDQRLLDAELAIRSNKDELARQGRLMAQAEKLIATRMKELNGNEDLANEDIPEVNIKGLLSSIVSEEEVRNAALIEADRLMRLLKKTRDEFQAIRKENQKRVDSLPKVTAEQSASR